MVEKWTKNSEANKQMLKLLRTGVFDDFMTEKDIASFASGHELAFEVFKPYPKSVIKLHLAACKKLERGKSGGEHT